MAPLRRFLLAAATVALLICLAAPPPPSAAAAAVPAAAKQSTTSDPMMPLVDMIGMRDVARRWVDQTDMVTIIKLDSQAAAMLVLGFVGNYPVAGGKVRDYYNGTGGSRPPPARRPSWGGKKKKTKKTETQGRSSSTRLG